jgi:hypothetical protein
MVMCNLANWAMCLINEDIDITSSDFAKQMPKPSFGKVIPIMNLHEDGVANGHHTPLYPYGVSTIGRFRLALEIGGRKHVKVLILSNMVSLIRGENYLISIVK